MWSTEELTMELVQWLMKLAIFLEVIMTGQEEVEVVEIITLCPRILTEANGGLSAQRNRYALL